MKSRAALLAGLFASVMATASCGENATQTPTAPVGPSSLSDLLLPRLGGLWAGTLTFNGVAGGGTAATRDAGLVACVGAAFDGVAGEINDYSLTIEQSGANLTGKLVSSTTGLACTYKGQIGSGNNLVLHTDTCQPDTFRMLCPTNTEPVERTMGLVGSSITATFDQPINVTRISGTAAHTYEVPGEGSVVVSHTFSNLTRR